MRLATGLLLAIAAATSTPAGAAQYQLAGDALACSRWDVVQAATDNLKAGIRGMGGLSEFCSPAPKGRVVDLIRRSGPEDAVPGYTPPAGYSLVAFCDRDGCIKRWVLSTAVGNGGRP